MDGSFNSDITGSSTTGRDFSSDPKTGALTPWSVKGVSSTTRIAVRKAAKREGLKIGAWVDRILLEQARLILQAETSLEVVPDPSIKDLEERLQTRMDTQFNEIKRMLAFSNNGNDNLAQEPKAKASKKGKSSKGKKSKKKK